MKAFHFQLEQLLRLKLWREEEAEKALAVETQARDRLQARLNELKAELLALVGAAGAAGALGAAAAAAGPGTEYDFDFHRRLRVLQYARALEDQIDEQVEAIARQQKRVKEKADLLAVAMRDRKVLEKLRERRQEDYRLQRNRFEHALMDEAAAAMLRRQAGESQDFAN